MPYNVNGTSEFFTVKSMAMKVLLLVMLSNKFF